MADILLVILASLFIVLGLAGCILPVIPGPPLSFVGLLILRFTVYVPEIRMDNFDERLWYLGGAALVVTVLDYLVPVWGTKRFGGSRSGTWGAAIGLIIGLFFAPIGLIAGPFLGAVVGELAIGRDEKSALRSGVGSLIGFLTGVVLKLVVSGLITWYYFKELLF